MPFFTKLDRPGHDGKPIALHSNINALQIALEVHPLRIREHFQYRRRPSLSGRLPPVRLRPESWPPPPIGCGPEGRVAIRKESLNAFAGRSLLWQYEV